MSDDPPLVSIVVPVLDEASRIEPCLRAVLAQDWPADRLEVVLVDGGADGATSVVARPILDAHPDVRSVIVANPGGGRGSNLNRGLEQATGDIVCRVDARSLIPPHYVATCAEVLADPAVTVVGGSQVSVAPGRTARAVGIGRALNNRLAMGMARYRRGGPSGPADTVYLGAFRRTEVEEVGGWDEGLAVNEDFDLNQRLGRRGTVWFDDRLAVDYRPRDSVVAIAEQYWGFGRWKVRYLRSRAERPRVRQVAGLAVLPAAVVGAVVIVRLPGSLRSVVVPVLVGGALAMEQVGTSDHRGSGSLVARAWSVLTGGAVVGGWSAGAWWELITGRRDP